jgi:nitroreductase
MEVMDAIKARRSIRKFKPDPVSEESLVTVLEGVKWAPSWANTQCWEVIVIHDEKIKAEVATALPKGNPALVSLTQAPLLLVLCGIKGKAGFYGGQPKTEKGDWYMFDLGIACQSLCLAAHSLGLGTVIVGMFDHARVAEILGVPPNVEVVAMTPLGYPLAPGTVPNRKDLSQFVHRDRYQGKP